MITPSIQQIKDAYQKKDYTYFTSSKPYNLNIWGIRKQYGEINKFDDLLGISFVDENGKEIIITHKGTVDPGKYYMATKLGNPNGTFILAPGQYRSCWKTGEHGKTDYFALVQVPGYKGFNGWRDNLLDGKLQRRLDASGNYFNDVQGLNMHRSSSSLAALVGEYSAGCQVRQENSSHLTVMNVIKKSLKYFPDKFSYTLFDEEEVFGVPTVVSKSATRGGSTTPQKWPEDYIKMEG